MKVITAYPVIIDSQRKSPNDYYLNLTDEQKAAGQSGSGKPKPSKTTGAGAEVAAAQGKQGVLDKIGEALGITDDKAAEKPDKKGMSKTVKYVLIGVGVLAVLGLGYALLKKK